MDGSHAAPSFAGVERISVLVADDHPVYREGIVRAVKERPELELVGEVATGREALEAIQALRPQVAVLDMKLPDLDGAHVLTAINREGLPTKVVFVSAYLDSEVVYAAIGGGARAYLSKDATGGRSATPSRPSSAGRRSSPPRSRPASPMRSSCARPTTRSC
jgi:two-component system nitrate/nitrite response regulator NarL